MGIIARARFWRPGHLWGANRYKFLIRWERPPAQMYNGAKLSSKFPEPEKREEREKYGSLADLQKAKEKVLGWLTEGSALWKLANEF